MTGEAARAGAARVLDLTLDVDRAMFDRLRADSRIEVLDVRESLAETARGVLTGGPGPAVTDPAAPDPAVPDPGALWTHWAYYPWRRAVVSVLPPATYRRVRLDRNRHLVTAHEQQRLGALRVGVVGLSVGHAVAHTLAMAGVCGALRLADFDTLELTNLNRVPGTVFDLGINKAVGAARRIAELDPYLAVETFVDGVRVEDLGSFLDGLDVLVEECDSLDVKVLVREAARARGIPVLMATSDRGMVDVERFDVEPDRPLLHGLLGDTDAAELSSLSSRDKVPHVLRLIDAAALSPRAAASLVEVGRTLATWPQLAGDVVVGAGAVAEAVRRIGLDEPLPSGRVRIDLAELLAGLQTPTAPTSPAPDPRASPSDDRDATHGGRGVGTDPLPARMAAAARRAPSGGNAQPWTVHTDGDTLRIALHPERTSRMDVGHRASAAAVGAAAFNARVAAAAGGRTAVTHWSLTGGPETLVATVAPDAPDAPDAPEGSGAALAALYDAMLDRATNRRLGDPEPLDGATAAALREVADAEGGRVRLLTDRADIAAAAALAAASDRIRFLTADLHREMIGELRWPGALDGDTGIDVASLELDAGDLAALEVLRRGDVMARLRDWDAGAALGDPTRTKLMASSALAVVLVEGHGLLDHARGGAAMEAVWIEAQRRGYGVQPVSPVFLYARSDDDVARLAPPFAAELGEVRSRFLALVGVDAGESPIIVLRLARVGAASVRSRRIGDR